MSRHETSPQTADEQEHPQPERPVTPDEEAGMALQDLENPPQAEGPRDDEENPDARDRDSRRKD